MRRLRRAEKAGVIQRANRPEKWNLKQFVPTPRHRFAPDPRELFQKLKFKEPVRFVHPVTGEWLVYSRTRNLGFQFCSSCSFARG